MTLAANLVTARYMRKSYSSPLSHFDSKIEITLKPVRKVLRARKMADNRVNNNNNNAANGANLVATRTLRDYFRPVVNDDFLSVRR
uniref:Uncharacterized protein n=1 Tax=Cannabis sativa TaxID=3483 RepID=A0A803NTN8_CANSA